MKTVANQVSLPSIERDIHETARALSAWHGMHKQCLCYDEQENGTKRLRPRHDHLSRMNLSRLREKVNKKTRNMLFYLPRLRNVNRPGVASIMLWMPRGYLHWLRLKSYPSTFLEGDYFLHLALFEWARRDVTNIANTIVPRIFISFLICLTQLIA